MAVKAKASRSKGQRRRTRSFRIADRVMNPQEVRFHWHDLGCPRWCFPVPPPSLPWPSRRRGPAPPASRPEERQKGGSRPKGSKPAVREERQQPPLTWASEEQRTREKESQPGWAEPAQASVWLWRVAASTGWAGCGSSFSPLLFSLPFGSGLAASVAVPFSQSELGGVAIFISNARHRRDFPSPLVAFDRPKAPWTPKKKGSGDLDLALDRRIGRVGGPSWPRWPLQGTPLRAKGRPRASAERPSCPRHPRLPRPRSGVDAKEEV